MTPETEAGLRAQIAALQAQVAAEPFIPALPTEHDGQAIEWRPWEEAVVIIAHYDNGCAQCDHPGPSLLAFGLAGPGNPLIRFNAHRCPRCQEMTVYHRVYDSGRIGARLEQIAYSTPRTIAAAERGGAS